MNRELDQENELAYYFYKATLLLLTDHLPDAADVIFLPGRSYGDETGLLELSADLYHKGKVKNIIIPGTDGQRYGGTTPGEAWAGQKEWKQRFLELGVENVLTGKSGYHTRGETDSFILESKENDWQSALVVTQPHQILRTFLGIVQYMKESNINMDVYSLTPSEASWQALVFGSQGIQQMPRILHIKEEFDRILKYQKQGLLASFEELFSYLTKRNHFTT